MAEVSRTLGVLSVFQDKFVQEECNSIPDTVLKAAVTLGNVVIVRGLPLSTSAPRGGGGFKNRPILRTNSTGNADKGGV